MQDSSEAIKKIARSGLVHSGQTGVHPHLKKNVRRHMEKPWLQPFHKPTVEAYRLLKKEGVFSGSQPFVLDSGCGTGESTQRLADMFPNHVVIGVDRSHVRLAKGLHTAGGAALLRGHSKWTPGQARGDGTPVTPDQARGDGTPVIPGLTRNPFLIDKR